MWLFLFISTISNGYVSQNFSFDSTYLHAVNKTLVLKLVNQARAKGQTCGSVHYPPAPALKWNPLLEAAASNHSEQMLKKHFFSHFSSDGSDPGGRISSEGYAWKCFGENIGMGYKNENEVIDGWLHSPNHCRNIMDRKFSEMGVGRAGDYWTQDFGTQ